MLGNAGVIDVLRPPIGGGRDAKTDPHPHPARRTVAPAAPARPIAVRANRDGRSDGLRGLKDIDASAAGDKAAEVFADVKAAWDASDDKPAIVGLTVAGFLALIAVNAVAGAVDRVPIVSDLLELVGLTVTGWFAYRNLIFKPDREA